MNFVRRPGLWVLLLPILLLSCVDGANVTESDWTESAALALVPRIIEPVGTAAVAGAVDQIRLTARHAGTQAVLATSDQTVDPSATSWQLSFDVPVPADGAQVLVDVELISGGVVEWSGTQGPLTLTAGAPTAAQEVPVYRGPLDNLSVTGITISGAPTSLAQGSTTQLTATLQTNGATGSNPTIFWGSTDLSVATVAGDGTVTGVAPGTATITASAGPVSDEVSFPITTSPGSIVVTPATATASSLGEQLTFQAQVLDQAGTVMPGAPVTWSSSDPTVLQAVSGGDFLTVGNGTAQAIATSTDAPSVSGSASATVRQDITTLLVDQPVVGLTALGEAVQIVATPLDALGATVSDAALVWTSSDPAVATVSATGLITAVAAGTATVSVTASEPAAADGADGDDAPARVPTTETVSVTVTLTVPAALTLTPPSAAMTQIGGTLQLVAEYVDATGGVSPATGLVWISTQSTVASVDSNGLVTAISNGSTIIRATGQGLTASASITVGGADLIISAFMVTPDGGSTVNDVTMTSLMVYVDNVGSFAAPASDLALRVLDAGTNAPITPDVTVAVPALPAGGQHIVSMTLGGQSPGSLPASVIFEAVADVGGIVAEFDENNNKATSASFPVAGGGGSVPPGTTHQWTGAVDSDWFTTGNWSAGTIPTSSDHVWIPVAPGTQPVISAPGAATGNLILEAGATLSIGSQILDVFGDLDAGTTITGSGQVRMFTTGTTVQGQMSADLFIGAKIAASGQVTVGNLVVDGATSTFDVNGQFVRTTADFTTQNGGGVRMNGFPGALLEVTGLATFNGGGLPGDLTQGTINFVGDLQGGTDPTAFAPTTGHVSRFAGSSLQDITFLNPGAGQQRFGDVDVASGALVTFSSNAHFLGSLIIQGTLDVPSGRTVDVDGNVDVQAGGSLNVDGTLTAIGACSVTGTVTGAGTSPCVAPAFSKTWVGGAGGGATDWDNPNNWSPIGVPGIGDDAIIPVTGNDPVTTTSVDINDLTVQPLASVTVSGPTLLRVYGDLDAGTGINGPSSVRIKGTGSLVQGIINTQLRIDAAASAVASGPLTIANSSSLVLADHFSVGGQVVSVAGAFNSFGAGLLEMTAGGVINIGGAADFDGISTAGVLTSGQLVLNNDLSTGGANIAQFQPSGTHHTFFTGATPSQINFANPGSDFFQELTVANTGGVTLASDADVTGDLLVSGLLVVPAGRTLSVVGAVTVAAGGSITVDGTLSTPGGCTIIAGGSVTGTGTHACAASAFTKVWVGGDPGGVTDWFNANNWNPAGIPISTDDVLIPPTANNPVAGTTTIRNLQVDVAATLDLNGGTMTFDGDLEAFGPISNGTMLTNTNGGILEGMIPGLTVGPLSTRSLTAQLDVSGNALLQGQLILGAHTLNVTGDFDTSGGNGRVIMQDAAGILDVDGTITFGGTGQNGFLSNGTIYAFGDFQTSVTNSTTSFSASGGHLVIFDGVGPQTLTMGDPNQPFADLANENTGSGLTFGSDVLVQGVFSNDPLGTVTGPGRTLKVTGGVDDTGAGLTVGLIDLAGSPSIMPGNINGDVRIGATVNWPNASFISGNLDVPGLLRANSHTITVGGNLTVSGASARLQMNNASDQVVVYGTTLFDGAGLNSYLTNGILEVRGDFTVASTHSPTSFVSSVLHEVILGGVATQTISMSNPGPSTQRFFNLTARNSLPDAQITNPLHVLGTLDIESGVSFDMNGNRLFVGTALMDPGQGFVGPEIEVTGSLTAFPPAVTTNLFVSSTWNVTGPFTLTGNLDATAGNLWLDSHVVTISGDATFSGTSRLYMTDPVSALDVAGNFSTTTTSSMDSYLTGGTVRIAGNFSQAGHVASYRSRSGHRTEFNGAGAQAVTFANPAPTSAGSQFGALTIMNASIVTASSHVYTEGTADVQAGGSFILTGQRLYVTGALLDPAGGLNTPEIHVTGSLTSFPAAVTTNLFIASSWNLSNPFALTGNLDVSVGNFWLDTHVVGVTGDVTLSGSSRLYMTSAASALDIAGDLTITSSSSMDSYLTGGTVRIAGNFSQAGNVASYRSRTNHVTEFNGAGAQSVTFANPASTSSGSQFGQLNVLNGSIVTLSSHLYVEGLTDVQTGGSLVLTGQRLYVGGALQDPAAGLVTPELYVYGNLTAFPSAISTNLFITSAWNVSNPFTLTGDLDVMSGNFWLDTHVVTVTGNAQFSGTSRLYMTAGGSALDVSGDLTMATSTSLDGYLTGGTVRIGGNFSQTGNAASYRSTNTHTTEFVGSGAQSLLFTNPGSVNSSSQFANLTIGASAVVTSSSHLYGLGTINVLSGGTLDLSGQRLYVAGALVDPASGLTTPEVYIYGNATAFPAAITTNLFVTAAWNLPNPVTLTGDLDVMSGNFWLDTHVVTVNGNAQFSGTSRLYMTAIASALDVTGNLTMITSTSLDGYLTAGTVRIAGNFTQAGNGASYRATGTHATEFNGSGAQTLTFTTPGNTGSFSRFSDLIVSNTGGTVTGTSSVYVGGTGDVNSGAALDLSGQQLYVTGGLLDPAGGLTVPTVYVNGNATAFPTNLNAALIVVANWSLPNDVTVSGVTTVNNVTLTFDAHTLTANSNFIITGTNGRIYMNNAASTLDANANFSTTGTSMDGYLINGRLEVAGNFTVAGANGAAFRATGSHTTVFDGSGAQSMSFAFPGPAGGSSQFMNLDITNPGGVVSAASFIYATGTVDVTGANSFDLTGQRLNVAGGLVDPSGALNTPWISTLGNLTTFPNTVTAASVSIEASWNLNGSTTINGDVTVLAGTLQLDANSMTVNGNFITGGTGRLYMNNPSSTLDVNGFFTAGGISHNGYLAAGSLFISGDFLQVGAADAFRGTSTHTTYLDGTGAQNVQFTNPGTGGGASQFRHLSVTNTGGQVTFASDAFIEAQFTMGAGSQLGQSGGSTLQVGDGASATASLNVTGGTFNGLPLRLVSNAPFGAANTFNNATLSGYAATDTQIYIRAPGTDTETWTGLTFSTAPTTGGFYIDMDSSNAGIITLNVTGTTPGNPAGPNSIGTNAILNWS